MKQINKQKIAFKKFVRSVRFKDYFIAILTKLVMYKRVNWKRYKVDPNFPSIKCTLSF